ncbi:hypothetical protein [Paraliomyxa miuraensis]|uniref:hypothetical protein n=1 Tax=Paraliomyxa miuraensis TaxID=376150 RepID=UPI002257A0CF|nr:hypothetical protein [Paraliomyxa miuraensis]MCX4241107.1 hypothetical protein [Paraliomyxa miuraensis]
MKHPRALLARVLPSALALALVGPVALAHADEEGKVGRITRLRINTPGSADHSLFHGSLTVDLVGSTSLVEYRWGGSSCPGVKLTDQQLDMLTTAFVQRNRTRLVPRYTLGEGMGTRCLVSFELVAG